ncbi:MAG: hypothetical protein N3F09_02470 [Bacteroidia bacterium]|nr:hypothetical protein [Bacteroidia bacterium]
MNRWEKICKVTKERFGKELEIDELLFVIGLQESGQSYRNFSKDEKINIFHVAICSLLEPYGFYKFIGKDADGWPHWKAEREIPELTSKEQHHLMLVAIEDYFKRMGYLSENT